MDKRDYLQFGDLKLPVLGGIYAFGGDRGYDYAEYALASGKPMTKPIGPQLSTISLSVMLRRFLGDDIPGTINLLDNMRESGEAFDLIFINGLYKGKYHIQKIRDRIEKTLPSGEVLEYDMTIDIREYSERVVLTSSHTQKMKPLELKTIQRLPENRIQPQIKEQQVNAEMQPINIKADKVNTGKRLQTAMNSLNKSASQISAIIQENEDKVKSYLTGKYAMPVNKALMLAQNLGIDISWLYTGAGAMIGSSTLTNAQIRQYRETFLIPFVK